MALKNSLLHRLAPCTTHKHLKNAIEFVVPHGVNQQIDIVQNVNAIDSIGVVSNVVDLTWDFHKGRGMLNDACIVALGTRNECVSTEWARRSSLIHPRHQARLVKDVVAFQLNRRLVWIVADATVSHIVCFLLQAFHLRLSF